MCEVHLCVQIICENSKTWYVYRFKHEIWWSDGWKSKMNEGGVFSHFPDQSWLEFWKDEMISENFETRGKALFCAFAIFLRSRYLTPRRLTGRVGKPPACSTTWSEHIFHLVAHAKIRARKASKFWANHDQTRSKWFTRFPINGRVWICTYMLYHTKIRSRSTLIRGDKVVVLTG